MRTKLLALICVGALGVCAYLGARNDGDTVTVRLKLVDARTGQPVGGIVRLLSMDQDKPLALPKLYHRLRGLEKAESSSGWYVVPAGGADTEVPRGKWRLEAVSGLESQLVRQEIALEAAARKELTIQLPFLPRPEKDQWVAGNTHLHLRNMTLEEADEYLRQIPAADGLKVMFVSYLERNVDDQHYITNRYPVGDLKQFQTTGVLFNNGEEHRHNFEGFGQGYGHVMFLDLKQLVKPVSLGPGITGAGNDDRALQPGLAEARQQGATILWCHNTNGYEDVPSALAGRFDALNVYDGSRTGTYEDNYYRYLNTGLRMPISTGTDWFIYDFSRVYAQVEPPLTIKSWLEAVKAGRCYATNGPLLGLTVDRKGPGTVLRLDQPKAVRVEAWGQGRNDFQQLQLVHNGKVIRTVKAEKNKEGHHAANLLVELKIDEPGWFAVRIDSSTKNELDRPLYAHSSPVYVDYEGKRVFDLDAARDLLLQLEQAQAGIRAKGKFSSPEAQRTLLGIYEQAVKDVQTRINQRGAKP
jgi:hypothetical protein